MNFLKKENYLSQECEGFSHFIDTTEKTILQGMWFSESNHADSEFKKERERERERESVCVGESKNKNDIQPCKSNLFFHTAIFHRYYRDRVVSEHGRRFLRVSIRYVRHEANVVIESSYR